MTCHTTITASPAEGAPQHAQVLDTLVVLGALAGGAVQPASDELAGGVDRVNDGRRILLETCVGPTKNTANSALWSAACR